MGACVMAELRHFAPWYPTAAYLYVLCLDTLALAWEYLRRHPDYRIDWLRRARRPDAAHHWGLRLLEDPTLDARDAHPAWLPGHEAVVQLHPDADPPPEATAFAFWRIPGHKQLLHDGKGLALIARSPGLCQRYALAPGLEDGMAVAYAHRDRSTTHAPDTPTPMARPRPPPAALLELHTDRKSTRLNSSHLVISYAVFCLKKKKRGGMVRRRYVAGGEGATLSVLVSLSVAR